jgi:hypothetical protein
MNFGKILALTSWTVSPGLSYQISCNCQITRNLTSEQILDKSVLGYGAIFGLQQDTGLKGNQYSLVGSIAPIAQLAVSMKSLCPSFLEIYGACLVTLAVAPFNNKLTC